MLQNCQFPEASILKRTLRDTTVTIALFGTETKRRKHVDWEIYSSMIDGRINKRSGIIVVGLPTIGDTPCWTSHTDEKENVYPEIKNWISIEGRSAYENRYPYLSERIIKNLMKIGVKISVVPWSKIENNPDAFRFLIEAAYRDRLACEYDFSTPMRRHNA